MIEIINDKWQIIQDVNDAGEKIGLFKDDADITTHGAQFSEWEELSELKHLQLVFAPHPYYGRDLRYFNEAPWWYRREIIIKEKSKHIILEFEHVDYYCKVWVNGIYLGCHEGYSMPFSFDIVDKVNDGKNIIIVKVWSPWDKEMDGNNPYDRTYRIKRNMVKGSYEHSDTFIQRDINPIGIYGNVSLDYCDYIIERPKIEYTLSEDLGIAELFVKFNLSDACGRVLRVILYDNFTDRKLFEYIKEVKDNCVMLKESIGGIKLWNTWDKGIPYTYRLEWQVSDEVGRNSRSSQIIGFRSIQLNRTKKETAYYLNNKRMYVRGTSYYPDFYQSAMYYDRYKRDIKLIKEAGFNLVRLHVHVENPAFYDLCTEYGIAIIQDSEYNWMHNDTAEFYEKFISIYLETVRMLKSCPAVITWVLLNEPGFADPSGRYLCKAMTVNPAPELFKKVNEETPDIPIIKGSYCTDDLDSGDSHNYTGSLYGGVYTDIYGTEEKLNTEFGFDAISCLESLKKSKAIIDRYRGIDENYIREIQNYQYKLIKYFIEHYRMQKYNPNAGYIQFMFIDNSPTSFFGFYDWYGIPKKSVDVLYFSNRPIGIFAKYKDKLDGIYAVNDFNRNLTDCEAIWTATDKNTGAVLFEGKKKININADGIVLIEKFDKKFEESICFNLKLILLCDGELLAENYYENMFTKPQKLEGYPEKISHEYGIRLFKF